MVTTKKGGAKKAVSKKRGSQKRDLIKPKGDARYVKRSKGKFTESDDMGESLKADRRTKAKKKVKPGYGDQGDQPKRARKSTTKKK